MSDTTTASAESAVRPFRIEVPQGEIDELRRRINATRWPTRELVTDRSQGVQLAAIQNLARYWTTEYDWRRCEARLNALPQFKTEIDGLNIHFIHVESAHKNALPLIMTHGWPGSVVELLETIGPLTDPTAHGGRAEDAFHLVLPSIPGYGFSDEPTELGWGPIRIGQAWAELMRRLGYTRYVAQGGDVGSQVTDAMGRLALDGLIGIHTNLLTPALGDAEALSESPPSTATRRSPAVLLTDNLRAISPGNTSSTTSPCIGSQAPGRRLRARTGKKDKKMLVRRARLPRRSRFRSASRRSPGRSGGPRAAGSRRRTPTSSTSTRWTRAVTSPLGRNRGSSRKSCAPPSARCASRHS